MGRPLFSSSVSPAPSPPPTTTVVVRTEEAPALENTDSGVRTWSYWNAFDPDADEFFESSDAVYEAFINPDATTDDTVPAIVARFSSLHDPDSDSSSSSSGTLSGRISPSAVSDVDEDEVPSAVEVRDDDAVVRVGTSQPGSRAGTPPLVPSPVLPVAPIREVPVLAALPPPRPSTPPNTRNMTMTTGTNDGNDTIYVPSPPPSVTPRRFAWPPYAAYPASPLPNRNARMSVAHIAPTYAPTPAIRG